MPELRWADKPLRGGLQVIVQTGLELDSGWCLVTIGPKMQHSPCLNRHFRARLFRGTVRRHKVSHVHSPCLGNLKGCRPIHRTVAKKKTNACLPIFLLCFLLIILKQTSLKSLFQTQVVSLLAVLFVLICFCVYIICLFFFVLLLLFWLCFLFDFRLW